MRKTPHLSQSPYKLCGLSTPGVEIETKRLRSILCYTVSLRSGWTTWDRVSETKTKLPSFLTDLKYGLCYTLVLTGLKAASGLCVLQSVRFSDLLSVFRCPALPTRCLSLSLSNTRSSGGPLSSTFPLTQTWDQFSRQGRWRFEKGCYRPLD